MVGSHDSGNPHSREHGLLLFLSPELTLGIARLQVKKELGRSYAGLLALTEGLFKLGAIPEDVYRALTERYSQPLVQERKKVTQKDLEARAQVQQLERQFSDVLNQWTTISSKAREAWIKRARAHPEVPNSRLVVGLANGSDKP